MLIIGFSVHYDAHIERPALQASLKDLTRFALLVQIAISKT